MVCIINQSNLFCSNEAMYLTNKSFFNSERHLNKIMNMKHENPGFFILITSIYNLYWVNKLSVDFLQIGISPKFLMCRTPLIRSLDITISNKYFNHFLEWSGTLELLTDLKLMLWETREKPVKLSEFPKKLVRLSFYSYVPLEMDEHPNLVSLSISDSKNIDLDNIPKLKRFEIRDTPSDVNLPIKSSVRREFELFNVSKKPNISGDLENIVCLDKFGKYISILIDQKTIIELNRYDTVNDSFYQRAQYAERLFFDAKNIKIEHCEGNKKIREISCSFKDVKRLIEYFENLELIDISSVKPDEMDDLWEFVKNTKIDVEYRNEYDKIFHYKKKYEEIPPNLEICVEKFNTDDLDSLFNFVGKLDLEYFTVNSNSKFDTKWFEKYNYAKTETSYFFTKKPHPSVTIFGVGRSKIEMIESNVDHFEIFNCKCIDLRKIPVRNLYKDQDSKVKYDKVEKLVII